MSQAAPAVPVTVVSAPMRGHPGESARMPRVTRKRTCPESAFILPALRAVSGIERACDAL